MLRVPSLALSVRLSTARCTTTSRMHSHDMQNMREGILANCTRYFMGRLFRRAACI
jgi:hypothetical protein